MNKKQTLLFLGLCTAGLATGHAVKRMSAAAPPSSASAEKSGTASSGSGTSSNGVSASSKEAKAAVASSTLRSEDDLETIKTAEGPDLYARVALWMVDASEEDISNYWQHYRQQENRSNEINDLIFINWTRINPQGAAAAAKGTPDEHYVWWAWACNDPATALSTAIATNPDRVNNVTWGIGEFHPNWLCEHYDELPEDSRGNALSGLAKWSESGDPLEKLKFFNKQGRGTHPGIFKVLASRDPWAAYDWLQENSQPRDQYYYSADDPLSAFLKIAKEQHPDTLKRMADLAPSGEVKRRMEGALFESLLDTDPEAAVQQAKDTKAPFVASQRLAAAAMHYLSSDPDKAFELAADLFEASPNATSQYKIVKLEGSIMHFGAENQDVQTLTGALMAKNPARLLEMQLPTSDSSGPSKSNFSNLARQWAEMDLTGLAEWTKRQDDSTVRDLATPQIVYSLQNEGNFADAADWAMSMTEPRNYLDGIVNNWGRSEPQAALDWLESADLPAEQVERLKKSIGTQ